MDPGILIETYVPESTIRDLARRSGIRYSGKTKPELVVELIAEVGQDEAWALLDEYFEVGRSSVYWFSPQGIETMSRRTVEEALRNYNGVDLFDYSVTPDVSGPPGLICARWLTDDNLQVYFARVRHQSIVVGLERQIIPRTILSVGFLRIQDRLLENWGDADTAAVSATILADALGLSGFVSQAVVANEVGQFVNNLGARLVSDRFRDDEGRYDVIELVKREGTLSLEDEPECAERHSGKPHIRKLIEFDVPGVSRPVRMEITKRGGFRFQAYTPRQVIDHVLQQFRGLKGV